jgi:hypothetical protein
VARRPRSLLRYKIFFIKIRTNAANIVMPGPVPGIHVLGRSKKDVDGRVNPGHDEERIIYFGTGRCIK